MRRFLLVLLPVVVSGLAHAGEYKGEFRLGVLLTNGNSDTQSLNGKFAIDHTFAPWRQHFEASGLNTSDDSGQTAERYNGGYKLDFDFTDTDYAFFAADYSKDRFGGVREQIVESVGYGRRLLHSETHMLDIEVGAGARQQKDQANVRSDEAIGRASGKYQWKISDSSQFLQKLKVESGSDNTFSEAVSELKLSIVGNLHATLGFTVRNNSEVPVGTSHSDTQTTISLSYSFAG